MFYSIWLTSKSATKFCKGVTRCVGVWGRVEDLLALMSTLEFLTYWHLGKLGGDTCQMNYHIFWSVTKLGRGMKVCTRFGYGVLEFGRSYEQKILCFPLSSATTSRREFPKCDCRYQVVRMPMWRVWIKVIFSSYVPTVVGLHEFFCALRTHIKTNSTW